MVEKEGKKWKQAQCMDVPDEAKKKKTTFSQLAEL